jgi:hypothetical protein
VQYTPIAGPVLIPAAVDLGRPLPFNDDGLICPDRWVQYQAAAGPVAIPLNTGWWTEPGRIVPIRRLLSGHVAVKPIQPLDGAGRSDLPWLRPIFPLVLAKPVIRHTSAAPVNFTLGEGAPNIPWLVRGLPPVVPQYPTRHVLVLPVSATDGDRSTLPWLVTGLPPVLAKAIIRSFEVHPLQVDAEQITIPWLQRNHPLVLAKPVIRSESVVPFTRGQSPLLVTGLPLTLAKQPTRHHLALPVSAIAGDLSSLPWLLRGAPIILAKPVIRHQLADLPFFAQLSIILATPDVIVFAHPDVGIIQVRPDVGIVLVLPDVGDVEA